MTQRRSESAGYSEAERASEPPPREALSGRPAADRWPWPPGSATGVGSLPGTDIGEAVRVVLGELPDLPHLPELPARGPGADLVGRGAGLLVELPVELYAARWRVTRDLLERDLDAVTDQAVDFAGTFKTQAAGPWTLAGAIELPVGGRLLRDPGAVRDLVASLAEGLRAHVAELAARLPRARIILQLDEPTLPAVLAGRVATESGLGALRPVEAATARAALATVVEAVEVPVVVHCCAADVPLDVIRACGAAAVALDLGLMVDLDPLGEALDAGLGLIAGAVDTHAPSAAAGPPSALVADRVRQIWRRLGFPAGGLPAQVVTAPACGLAGLPAETARATMAACRDAARRLAEDAEG